MRRFIPIIALAFVAGACGDSGAALETLDSSSSESMPAVTAASGDDATLPESDYPDHVVTDLAGGEVNLKELALEQNPVLLWFWAPH